MDGSEHNEKWACPVTTIISDSFPTPRSRLGPSPHAGEKDCSLAVPSDLPISGRRWIVKDIQDRTIALVAIILCLPLLAAIAAAIWLAEGRPIFFRQRRLGFGGRTFDILKFRTMRNADSSTGGAGLQLTTRGDARVFPVGRFLRQTSLDELPQLFNVMRGDMWVIGPRPHSPLAKVAGRTYAEVVEDYAARYRVKPGITGWAQVNGWRGPTEKMDQIKSRVAHDLFYIENWSVWLDLRILLRTASSLLHENAF